MCTYVICNSIQDNCAFHLFAVCHNSQERCWVSLTGCQSDGQTLHPFPAYFFLISNHSNNSSHVIITFKILVILTNALLTIWRILLIGHLDLKLWEKQAKAARLENPPDLLCPPKNMTHWQKLLRSTQVTLSWGKSNLCLGKWNAPWGKRQKKKKCCPVCYCLKANCILSHWSRAFLAWAACVSLSHHQ